MESTLQIYLEEINVAPLLSKTEEQDLARKIINDNDPQARDTMIRSNLRLVVNIAKNYANRGMPDAEWGEEVRAVVVSSGGGVSEEDVIQFCQDKLASFKRPRSVVFVDELPRNVMGKVLKRDLRDQHGV